MNFELPAFFLLFFYTLTSCFFEQNEKRDVLSFIFVFMYVVSVRLSGFDIDFHVYVATLHGHLTQMVINPYYLREWFYWILSTSLFNLLGNQYVVILLYDLLVVLLVIGIRRKLKLPHYFIGLYFLFFPSVFGINNIFRQYIMVALLAYSLFIEGKLKKLLVYSLAVFTHNSAILFFPLLFVSNGFFKNSRRKDIFAFIISSVVILCALTLFAHYGATTNTGLSLQLLYLFSIGVSGVVIYYLLGTKLRGYDIDNFLFVTYSVLIMAYSTVITTSARAERIGMVIFMMLLPFLVKRLDSSIKQKKLVRISLCLVFTLPSLIFPNAIRLLSTGLI